MEPAPRVAIRLPGPAGHRRLNALPPGSLSVFLVRAMTSPTVAPPPPGRLECGREFTLRAVVSACGIIMNLDLTDERTLVGMPDPVLTTSLVSVEGPGSRVALPQRGGST